MKPSFLNHHRPLLTTMVELAEPIGVISEFRNAIYDGTDALGFEISRIEKQYRTEENYKKMLSYAEDKPVYVTNYRTDLNVGMSDEELVEGLMLALKSGATLCDIIGDLYDPSPYEITYDSKAIEKQQKLIERIHSNGGEVLISSHIKKFLPSEKVVEIARAQEDRGADIAKVVTMAENDDELMANLHTIRNLKKELSIPFLFLACGSHCKLQRMIGPAFGCNIILCVPRYSVYSSLEQPLLRSARAVLQNLDWNPNRN